MATSNGGGMEVDGAGEYFLFISPFPPRIDTNPCVDGSVCCVLVSREAVRGEAVALEALCAARLLT